MPQSLSNLLVHLIFSTAHREPFLKDESLRSELHRYLGGLINKNGGQVLAVGGVEDHVHLCFALPRTMALADMARELKRASSLWIKEREPLQQQFAWQGGYGAFSVGQMETPQVISYINQQEEHHRKRSFQEEYRAFLEKYQIPYDERYVWD